MAMSGYVGTYSDNVGSETFVQDILPVTVLEPRGYAQHGAGDENIRTSRTRFTSVT